MSDDLTVKQMETNKYPNRWKKGQSGNPYGRPNNPEVEELRQAIRSARKLNGNRSILAHFVQRAYINDVVLIALMKKLLPDKLSPLTTITNNVNNISPVQAKKEQEMQERLRARLDRLLEDCDRPNKPPL